MTGFKKPSTLARELKVKVHTALGQPVPADPRRGYTDRMEFLSTSVLIGYKDYGPGSNYPTAPMKAAALEAANTAARIIRKANDAFAGITFLRRKESALMTAVLDKHFGLIAGDTSGSYLTDNVVDKKFSVKAVGNHDRRWVVEKIREKMLSLSFHLNTGIYLIDLDANRRDIKVGQTFNPATADPHEEAYVGWSKREFDDSTWQPTRFKLKSGLVCGFQNGQIHVSLQNLENYSTLSYARVIIHEAAHKHLGVPDIYYAHDANYPTMSLTDTLNNADSYAWAALSLYCGNVKMGDPSDEPTDWAHCAKP